MGVMTGVTMMTMTSLLLQSRSLPVSGNKGKQFKVGKSPSPQSLEIRRTIEIYHRFLVRLRVARLDLERIPSMQMMKKETSLVAQCDNLRQPHLLLPPLQQDSHKSLVNRVAWFPAALQLYLSRLNYQFQQRLQVCRKPLQRRLHQGLLTPMF
jgi:hypothetical protein